VTLNRSLDVCLQRSHTYSVDALSCRVMTRVARTQPRVSQRDRLGDEALAGTLTLAGLGWRIRRAVRPTPSVQIRQAKDDGSCAARTDARKEMPSAIELPSDLPWQRPLRNWRHCHTPMGSQVGGASTSSTPESGSFSLTEPAGFASWARGVSAPLARVEQHCHSCPAI
jgi:hypothetical protein